MTKLVLLTVFATALTASADVSKYNGTVCWKNTKVRGVGIPIHDCQTGFEKNGLLCYPKCADGFTGVGPVCWENCQSGEKDIGAFCTKGGHWRAKKSDGRGAGVPLGCGGDHPDYDTGLCYKPCPASSESFKGIGPVCWQECEGSFGTNGGAMCCKSRGDCDKFIWSASEDVIKSIIATIQAATNPSKAVDAAKDWLETALKFDLPLCDAVEQTQTLPITV